MRLLYLSFLFSIDKQYNFIGYPKSLRNDARTKNF